MRRPYGLRPRLLAALVLTSAATLLAAAVTLFGPLQERLREESAKSLEAAVLAAREGVENGYDKRDYSEAFGVARRTGSRVVIYNRYGQERVDSGTGPFNPPGPVL